MQNVVGAASREGADGADGADGAGGGASVHRCIGASVRQCISPSLPFPSLPLGVSRGALSVSSSTRCGQLDRCAHFHRPPSEKVLFLCGHTLHVSGVCVQCVER